MRGSRRAFATAAAAAVLAAGRAARAQTPLPHLRIGAALDDESTPVLYAQSAGIFRKHGLDVEIVKLTSGSAVAAAVVGGSLEIGKSSTIAIIAAHLRGVPFQIIAPIADYRSDKPHGALIVPIASTAKTGKDFSGKTIGVTSLQDLNSLAMLAWLEQTGGDPASVKFVELPPPAIGAALEAGRIDGAPVFEPALTNALATGKAKIGAFVYDAIAKRFQGAIAFANQGWIAANPAVVDAFTHAMFESSSYVDAHESEMIPLVASFVGMDPATLAKMRHPGRPLYVDLPAIQPLIDLEAKFKVIPASFPARELISDEVLKPPR
jgi:NitT/TauT family transport system substrate-binding protein